MLNILMMEIVGSVTSLGELLDFGQLFKDVATISLPKSPTFLGNFCNGAKIFNFFSLIIEGNFYRHLATFYWSHWLLVINDDKEKNN